MGLIRSPTTLKDGQYTYNELEMENKFLYYRNKRYLGTLEAVDCRIRNARYDMVVECDAGVNPKVGLIRSPTTL